MNLQGKGFFIKDISRCEGGEPAAILAAAQAAGLGRIFVRIADGVRACGINSSGGDITAPLVQALQKGGLSVWGWHHLHGGSPSAEAAVAVARTQALGLEGYVLEARQEFKQPGMDGAARLFMSALRPALKIPIALSSYRFPNHHPELPWAVLLESCDLYMPQIYWEHSHNAGEQLRESLRQCYALPNARPCLPTGAEYPAPGWHPSPEDTFDFIRTARALGLPGVNFYSWEDCRAKLPQIWAAITSYTWPAHASVPPASPGAQPDLFLEQFLAALNSWDAARVGSAYDPAAVQVWSDAIRNGVPAIQAGYAALFASLPAGTTFSVSQVQAEPEARLFAWHAGPLAGETTLVLKNGKIILDYTFIS